jgi:hypothetical protein
MQAIDRWMFDIPLEERLQGRTSDIAAWTKTMQPTIRISISEAQNQLRTGHQDIRTFCSDTAATERSTNETLVAANTTTDNTATGRIGPRRTEVRQRPQQPRTQPAPSLTNIRRPRYQDIRNFLSKATAAVTTTDAMQNAMEETIAPTNNLISRCRAIRNRLQPPQSQATQDTAEEPTNLLLNVISRVRALRTRFHTPRTQETQATTDELTTSTDSTFSHLRALRNRSQTARTQASTHLAVLPRRTSPS